MKKAIKLLINKYDTQRRELMESYVKRDQDTDSDFYLEVGRAYSLGEVCEDLEKLIK